MSTIRLVFTFVGAVFVALSCSCGASAPAVDSDAGNGSLDAATKADATTAPSDAGDATTAPSDAGDATTAPSDSGDATTVPSDAGGKDAGPFGGEWPGDGGWGPDADLPYYPTNYDEPYRGQYTFTAPNGWINDVNGVWYYGGVYHLSYQAYPYTLSGATTGCPTASCRLWGHATSTDMVHWVTAPVMLDPARNGIPGDAWSGSAVVDVANTSGFQTGSNPVIVAIYTATSEGTSLAYSNDLGLTWSPYSGNPVAIGGPTATATRDPHVFWYEPGHEWVCAYYDNGTVFYTSPDLKNWTQTGSISFGYECPDIYELPVDGVATNTKWVVQNGAGQYLVGQFDGDTFTQDDGGPYAIDVGNAFYASQTFYRQTFPDSRVVQMAWMRSSSPTTAPWNQAISFPVVLGLTTFPEGVRVTRTPIAEINTLYGATQHWGPQTLTAGANLLEGVASKAYDFELVVDLTNTTATAIQFQLANETFTYDISQELLLGASLAPLNGQITVRILADWAEFDVFGNNGEFSSTNSFAFTPSDSSLSVTADGPITVVSADFRQLNRAWPGNAAVSSAQLDDADPSVVYSGAWSPVTGDNTYLDSTCSVGSGTGESAQATLSGTRFEWHGLKNIDLGIVDISLDGALVASNVDMYSPNRQIATIPIASGLTNGLHVVTVTGTGTKNAASAGTAVVHDFFASYVDPGASGGTHVDLEAGTPPVPTFLWLDAADITTIAMSGNAVSQWNDKSGNGLNALVESDTPPVYGTSAGPNGLPAIAFTESGQRLTTASVASVPQMTIFVVYEMTSNVAWGTLIEQSHDTFFSIRSEAVSNDNMSFHIVNNNAAPLIPEVLNEWNIIVAVQSSTATSVYYPGSFSATTTQGPIASGSSPISIGNASVSGLPAGGFVGEIRAYNSALSVAEQEIILADLHSKWGI